MVVKNMPSGKKPDQFEKSLMCFVFLFWDMKILYIFVYNHTTFHFILKKILNKYIYISFIFIILFIYFSITLCSDGGSCYWLGFGLASLFSVPDFTGYRSVFFIVILLEKTQI